jgi:hypothetical protein
MRHLSVGEAQSGDYSATARAESLAREDAERSEYLARRAKEVTRQAMDDPGECDECDQPLHPNAKGTLCQRCLKRIWMRDARAGLRATTGKTGRPKLMITYWVCGSQTPKWPNPYKSPRPARVCPGCRDKASRLGAAVRDGEITKAPPQTEAA